MQVWKIHVFRFGMIIFIWEFSNKWFRGCIVIIFFDNGVEDDDDDEGDDEFDDHDDVKSDLVLIY